MKTTIKLSVFMACAMLLLNSCSKKEDEENSKPVSSLENTIWYLEKTEKKSGSDWTTEKTAPDWMIFEETTITSSKTTFKNYQLKNRTIIIEEKPLFLIDKYSKNQLIIETIDHKERFTFRKIKPIKFSDLKETTWQSKEIKLFDDKTKKWDESILNNQSWLTFNSTPSGTILQLGDDRPINFKLSINGNLFDFKVNDSSFGICFITEHTSDEITFISVIKKQIAQWTFTLKK